MELPRLFWPAISATPSRQQTWRLYLGDMAPAMAISAKVRVVGGDDQAGGGLIAWAKDIEHYRTFRARTDGTVSIIQVDGEDVKTLAGRKAPPEVKLDLKQWTQLDVFALELMSNVTINGVSVVSMSPPERFPDTYFGIEASSLGGACQVEFKDIVVERRLLSSRAKR